MGTIANSDGELVEASRRGEHEAFGRLVARYQDVVRAVSYGATGDPGLSEDVAQETFIAAWRQLDRLRDTMRLRSWLCGIARNLARKARKRRRREDLVDTDDQVAPDGNPFDDAARGEVERVVREALAKVPDAYREVLVLYYSEDRSIREVADALGVSEAAVMQRMSRGRRYLADSVEQLVERSLRSERRPRRDLVAAVLAVIVAIEIPSRVDASPAKGSTMLKLALAASALVAAGTTVYLLHDHGSASAPATAKGPAPLHFGANRHNLAHAPTLGPTAAPRAIHSRSVAEADLGLLPADSDAVIGLNFAQIRGSALWQRFVAPMLAGNEELQKFQAQCGFDLLASLGSVSIGLKNLGSDDDVSGVIVIHGFEKAKSMSCFDKARLAASDDTDSHLTIDGDVILIGGPGNYEHAAFTFTDATTALVVLGPAAATRQSVEQVAAGGGTLATTSAFAETLQYVNTDDSLWMMFSDSSPIVKNANVQVAKYTPIQVGTTYIALNVTDSLALDAGFRLGSPATVANLVSTIQAHLDDGPVKDFVTQYFDQLDVTADGSDLIVSLAISGDQLISGVMALAVRGEITAGN
jgi:RNA polymerase sigma factor (sigma-70 family)